MAKSIDGKHGLLVVLELAIVGEAMAKVSEDAMRAGDEVLRSAK